MEEMEETPMEAMRRHRGRQLRSVDEYTPMEASRAQQARMQSDARQHRRSANPDNSDDGPMDLQEEDREFLRALEEMDEENTSREDRRHAELERIARLERERQLNVGDG